MGLGSCDVTIGCLEDVGRTSSLNPNFQELPYFSHSLKLSCV